MGEIRYRDVEPKSSRILVGSSTVTNIFRGDQRVWPPTDINTETICSLLWQTVNSNTRYISVLEGLIPIVTSSTAWHNHLQLGSPAACYVNFDSNNAGYGLLYNIFAKDQVSPPSGYRLPTSNDFLSLGCSLSGNLNPLGANPGEWDSQILTNTTGLGDTGLNVQGYGYASFNSTTSVLEFQGFSRFEFYWMDNNSPQNPLWGVSANSSINALSQAGFGGTPSNAAAFIRFIKDL
jgi:uncharacterized protein (TIGR02145 family)